MGENSGKDFGTWSTLKETKPRTVSRRMFLRWGAVLGAMFLGKKALDTVPSIFSGSNEQLLPGEAEIEDEVGDLFTRAELFTRYHTVIYDIQPSLDPNYVLLDFKRTAAETRLFQQLEAERFHLNTFLIDSHIVDLDKLTATQRTVLAGKQHVLDGVSRQLLRVQDMNRQEIASNRNSKQIEYQRRLTSLQDQRDREEISQERYEVELQALDYRYSRYIAGEPSQEDLFIGVRMLGITIAEGGQITPSGERISPEIFVFVAVRDPAPEITFHVGNESVTVTSNEVEYHNVSDPTAPRPQQSYPDLDSFVIDESNTDYVIEEGRTLGMTLRHELEHTRGVISERDADLGAVTAIEEASRRRRDENDSSGYWIVFRTPEGRTITQDNDQAVL